METTTVPAGWTAEEWAEAHRHREYMRRRRIEEAMCTPLAATWCPIHGDCTCDREENMDAWDCPLHNRTSTHAEVPHVAD